MIKIHNTAFLEDDAIADLFTVLHERRNADYIVSLLQGLNQSGESCQIGVQLCAKSLQRLDSSIEVIDSLTNFRIVIAGCRYQA